MESTVILFGGRIRNAYSCLSNFYPARVYYKNQWWATSEHAYQAEKTLVVAQQQAIRKASTPGQAKRLGQKVTLRSDWLQVRDLAMLDICMEKFSQNEDLKSLLLATGNAILVEHAPWGDYYWGDGGDGTGKNKLGKILMAVRTYLNVI